MKCKICRKDIMEHTKKQVLNCLEDAGITTKGSSPIQLLSEADMPVIVNYRHSTVRWDGGEIVNSKDIDLDLLRLCLLGDAIPDGMPSIIEEDVFDAEEADEFDE